MMFRSGEFAGKSSMDINGLVNSSDTMSDPPLKCGPALRPAQRSLPSLS